MAHASCIRWLARALRVCNVVDASDDDVRSALCGRTTRRPPRAFDDRHRATAQDLLYTVVCMCSLYDPCGQALLPCPDRFLQCLGGLPGDAGVVWAHRSHQLKMDQRRYAHALYEGRLSDYFDTFTLGTWQRTAVECLRAGQPLSVLLDLQAHSPLPIGDVIALWGARRNRTELLGPFCTPPDCGACAAWVYAGGSVEAVVAKGHLPPALLLEYAPCCFRLEHWDMLRKIDAQCRDRADWTTMVAIHCMQTRDVKQLAELLRTRPVYPYTLRDVVRWAVRHGHRSLLSAIDRRRGTDVHFWEKVPTSPDPLTQALVQRYTLEAPRPARLAELAARAALAAGNDCAALPNALRRVVLQGLEL